MQQNNITLVALKKFLRITGIEHDLILMDMLKASIEIAKEYIDNVDNEAVRLGMMTHISIMFDMNYIASDLTG